MQPSLLVSPSTRKIINELCELGWLYKKVNDWLKLNVETSLSMDVNQVTQALCFSIRRAARTSPRAPRALLASLLPLAPSGH